MATVDLAEAIEQVVAGADLGRPGARKTGRDQRWPYVPLVVHEATATCPKPWEEQVVGLAYATRQEALASAEAHVAAQRSALAKKLADPSHRALRERYGLPRELV